MQARKVLGSFHHAKRMGEWFEGFELLTLKSGVPMTPGSIYEIIISDDGHRNVMSEEIIDVNAPNKISDELNSDVLKSEFSFSLNYFDHNDKQIQNNG